MEAITQMPLSHPVYCSETKLKNWNGLVSVKNCGCERMAARLLKRAMPELTKQQHSAFAAYHSNRAAKLLSIWNRVMDRAAIETFGRPWIFTDYKICAIGCEDFSATHKRVLRHCAYRRTEHSHLARVHERLAKYARS